MSDPEIQSGSARPLLLFGLFFAAGAGIGNVVPDLGHLPLTVGWLLVPFACVSSRIRPVALLSLIACLGLSAVRLDSIEHDTSAIHRLLARNASEGEHRVSVTGRVSSFVVTHDWGHSFNIESERLHTADGVWKVDGKLRVSLRGSPQIEIKRGDIAAVTGNLSARPLKRNPFAFDYGAYLRRRGIDGLMMAEAGDPIMVVRSSEMGPLLTCRGYIKDVLRRYPDERGKAFASALLLGDRAGLDQRTRRAFAETGLAHLFAVSGLHVLLIALTLHALAGPLLIRLGCNWSVMEATRIGLSISVLVVYSWITGHSASVVRASVMASFLIAAPFLRRTTDPLNAMGGAGLVLLSARPSYLLDIGFLLSFSAVGSLLVCGRFMTHLLNRVPRRLRWAAASVPASIAATLGTAPALHHAFGYVAMAGLFLNILAIPVTSLLLSASLLLVLTGLQPVLAEPFAFSLNLLALVLDAGTNTAHGFSRYLLMSSELGWSVLCVPLLLLTAIWKRDRRRWRAACLLVAVSVPVLEILALSTVGHFRPTVEIVFFDVGHGDATLMRLPGNQTVLVDAGIRNRYVDHGTRTLRPHLLSTATQTIDALVLTHADADHIGGALSLIEEGRIGCVLDNGDSPETKLHRSIHAALETQGGCHEILREGMRLDTHASTRLYVLAPSKLHRFAASNNRSVVLLLAYGSNRVLLTGDIEKEAETQLMDTYCDMFAVNIVKVPHHGSETSSTQRLVDCLSDTYDQKLAVISVGSPIKYGLPDSSVVQRWISSDWPLHNTHEAGAGVVRLETSGFRRDTAWRSR